MRVFGYDLSMVNIQQIKDKAQACFLTQGELCLEQIIPDVDKLPGNLYLMTPRNQVIFTNQLCIQAMGAKNRAQIQYRSISEIGQLLGWSKEIIDALLINNELVIKKGSLSMQEYLLNQENNKHDKWQSSKHVIYNADGQVQYILGLSILAQSEVAGIFVHPKTQQVSIYLDKATVVKLTAHEFNIVCALLHGSDSNIASSRQILAISDKFSCQKNSRLVAHLIEMGIARDILRYVRPSFS